MERCSDVQGIATDLSIRACALNSQHSIHRHLGEEFALSPDDFGGHGCGGALRERVAAQYVCVDGHILCDELAGLH